MKKIIGAFIALYSAFALSATMVPVQLLNPTGSTTGKTIVSTGASSAPAWGSVPVNGLAAISANSVIGNATGSAAVPAAITVTGCNGAAQALQWTNGSGFGCNSNIATSGANTNITSLSSPTITTPNIVGTAMNNNASAGSVGEFVCAQVTNGGSPSGCATNSSTPVSLTTNTTVNVTSMSLTAGDWEISGYVEISGTGTTNIANAFGGSSVTSATLDINPIGTYWHFAPGGTAPTGSAYGFPIPTRRITLTGTTSVFLLANCGFTVSTCSAIGIIRARRPR